MSRAYIWISLLIFPFNIVGNVLVCVIVFSNISMRTFTNYLLVNLAIADLSYGLLQALGMIVHLAEREFDWSAFCKSSNYGVHVSCGVSIGTLTVIAVERFYAVVKPFSCDAKRKRKAYLLLVTLWVGILLFMSPTLFFPWGYEKGEFECRILKSYTPQRRIYYFFIIILFLFLPSFIIFYCYSRIIYTLWCSPEAAKVTTIARVKARRKLAQMLVVVSSIFVISWMTTCVVQLLILFGHAAPQPLETTSSILVHLNTCVNPIVYSLHSADFRSHLKKVFGCCQKPQTLRCVNQNNSTLRSTQSSKRRLTKRLSRVAQEKSCTACEEV
jgi:hypothetical protein